MSVGSPFGSYEETLRMLRLVHSLDETDWEVVTRSNQFLCSLSWATGKSW